MINPSCVKEKRGSLVGALFLVGAVIALTILVIVLITAWIPAWASFFNVDPALFNLLDVQTLILLIVMLALGIGFILLYMLMPRAQCKK